MKIKYIRLCRPSTDSDLLINLEYPITDKGLVAEMVDKLYKGWILVSFSENYPGDEVSC